MEGPIYKTEHFDQANRIIRSFTGTHEDKAAVLHLIIEHYAGWGIFPRPPTCREASKGNK